LTISACLSWAFRFTHHWKRYIKPTIDLIPYVGPYLVKTYEIGRDASNEPKPFAISVDIILRSSSNYVKFPIYSADLVIRNRLSEPLPGCSLYILSVSNNEAEVEYPRFVEKFDLLSGRPSRVLFAQWTSRETPYDDDNSITIPGPTGGLNGNVLRVSASGGSNIKMEIEGSDRHAQQVCYRVWVANRQLHAEAVHEII
jgi:hypothetical protein